MPNKTVPAADTGLPRRAFLRGLTTLPLIGGSVALIGRPSAAAEPATLEMMEAYKTWLHFEHRAVAWELAEYPEMVAWYGGDRSSRFRTINRYSSYVGESGSYHRFDGINPASGRAAVVLSAVGCDWREKEGSGR